jgi:hypothetical protein
MRGALGILIFKVLSTSRLGSTSFQLKKYALVLYTETREVKIEGGKPLP